MSRVTIKRKYTERHPPKRVNQAARVRNQVIEFVARNGEVTYDQLAAFVKEVSKTQKGAKAWLRKKSGLFNIKEGDVEKKVSLSRKGTKIYDSVMKTNESELFEENEGGNTFLTFEEFSSMNKEKKEEEEGEEEEGEEEEEDENPEDMKKDSKKKVEDDEEEEEEEEEEDKKKPKKENPKKSEEDEEEEDEEEDDEEEEEDEEEDDEEEEEDED
jgi:hypothetical protein